MPVVAGPIRRDKQGGQTQHHRHEHHIAAQECQHRGQQQQGQRAPPRQRNPLRKPYGHADKGNTQQREQICAAKMQHAGQAIGQHGLTGRMIKQHKPDQQHTAERDRAGSHGHGKRSLTLAHDLTGPAHNRCRAGQVGIFLARKGGIATQEKLVPGEHEPRHKQRDDVIEQPENKNDAQNARRSIYGPSASSITPSKTPSPPGTLATSPAV